MDCDYDPSQRREKTKKKTKTETKADDAKKKKKSCFASAVEKPKPVFDASRLLSCLRIHSSFSFALYQVFQRKIRLISYPLHSRGGMAAISNYFLPLVTLLCII
jgi:hypothetical protein